MYIDNAPAILAELNGEAFRSDASQLAHLTCPVLIVSANSSPPAFRSVDDTLAQLILGARHAVISGDHQVSPADPTVLEFLDNMLATG